MKYYKSESGQVFAYESDGSQDAYIKPDLVPMSAEEVEAHINPQPTQEELQRTRLAANNTAYNTATMAVTGDYPQLEKDTWPTQNAEASKWVADPEGAVTPWIDSAAQVRGLDREDYLRRTLVKAQQFSQISAYLTGLRQKYEDAIKVGDNPELDYSIAPEFYQQLQQQAQNIMTVPVAELGDYL